MNFETAVSKIVILIGAAVPKNTRIHAAVLNFLCSCPFVMAASINQFFNYLLWDGRLKVDWDGHPELSLFLAKKKHHPPRRILNPRDWWNPSVAQANDTGRQFKPNPSCAHVSWPGTTRAKRTSKEMFYRNNTPNGHMNKKKKKLRFVKRTFSKHAEQPLKKMYVNGPPPHGGMTLTHCVHDRVMKNCRKIVC